MLILQFSPLDLLLLQGVGVGGDIMEAAPLILEGSQVRFSQGSDVSGLGRSAAASGDAPVT